MVAGARALLSRFRRLVVRMSDELMSFRLYHTRLRSCLPQPEQTVLLALKDPSGLWRLFGHDKMHHMREALS